MYYTHHFAHRETLSRARSWLAQLGYGPHQVQAHTTGIPRLTVSVDSHRLAEIRLLVNALERSDPDAFPSFWDEARRPDAKFAVNEEVTLPEPVRSHSAVIGWHPPD